MTWKMPIFKPRAKKVPNLFVRLINIRGAKESKFKLFIAIDILKYMKIRYVCIARYYQEHEREVRRKCSRNFESIPPQTGRGQIPNQLKWIAEMKTNFFFNFIIVAYVWFVLIHAQLAMNAS